MSMSMSMSKNMNASVLLNATATREAAFFRHAVLTVTYVALNALVLVVGVAGNGLIIALFCRQRRMRTDTNAFITNLAISDVLICCVSPATLINTLLMDKQWTLGQWLCKTLPALITVGVFSSSFTMTTVALNRFLVARSNRHLSSWQRWAIVSGLWTVSALFSVPVALHSQVVGPDADGHGHGHCVETWGNRKHLRTAFSLSCLAVQFVLPTAVIAYCYGKLGMWLKLRAKMYDSSWLKTPGGASAQLKRYRDAASIRRKRVTNKMLVAIVVVYCASWLPLNALNLVLEFGHDAVVQWTYLEVVYMFTQILGSASAALNPCIFALLNKDYQRHLKSYLRNSTLTVFNFRLRMPQNALYAHPFPKR